MIKKFLIVNNELCSGYSDININNTIEYNFNDEEELNHFIKNPSFYRYTNGKLFYDENLKITYEQELNERKKQKELEELKLKRKELFKQYVDRSPMWYFKLTPEQEHELEAWYNTWCEMPEMYEAGTWIEPSLPGWLKPKRGD